MNRKNGRRRNSIADLTPKKKAAYADQQRHDQAGARGVCPHPDKIAYPDRKAAKTVAKRLARLGSRGRLHAYRCPDCGWFHLGTASMKPGPAPELP